MREIILHKFFEGEITAADLANDLDGSQERIGYDSTNIYVDRVESGSYKVRKQHLIALCDAFMAGDISSKGLNTIGFALMFSDFFEWDNDSKEGSIIAEVVSDWDNTSIGYEITDKNVWHWRQYLDTGFVNLDKNEIKYRTRSKGKLLGLYRQIDLILEKEWNPIGVSDVVRDEYQSYVPQIFRMKQKLASAKDIAEALYRIETDYMELPGNRENCERVAKMLVTLRVE